MRIGRSHLRRPERAKESPQAMIRFSSISGRSKRKSIAAMPPIRRFGVIPAFPSPNYHGRPAAADIAFSIAAVAQGWSESDIAAALNREYLSRNASHSRQAAYIRRTLSKAILWAA